jgi:hypothetical protein
VLSGEIDVEFDSGQVVTMKQSDTIVMRGVTHTWKNKSRHATSRHGFHLDRRRSFPSRRREEGRALSGVMSRRCELLGPTGQRAPTALSLPGENRCRNHVISFLMTDAVDQLRQAPNQRPMTIWGTALANAARAAARRCCSSSDCGPRSASTSMSRFGSNSKIPTGPEQPRLSFASPILALRCAGAGSA